MRRFCAWLRRERVRWRKLGLARKILILLFSVSLIPLACTLIMFYWLSASVMQAQTRELIQANLEQSASNVQNFWRTYQELIQSIYIDSFYGERLEPINLWDSGRYDYAKAEIMKKLEDIVYANPEILGIMVVGTHYDACFYDRITNSGQGSVCFDLGQIRENPYTNAAMEEARIVYSPAEHISDRDYGNWDVLYIACQLQDFAGYRDRIMGCVMLCVDEQALEDVYRKSNTRSNLTFIVNEYGDIVSFPQESLAGVNILEKTGSKSLETAAVMFLREYGYLDGERLEAVSREVMDGRLWVINVQNLNYAMQNFRYIVGIMLLFGVLAGLLCMLLAIEFSYRVDGSVQPILRAMKKADQGDWRVKIEPRGDDEFAWISRQFNRMMDKIRSASQQEKEALLREKNAEIKALEAQINPHFLYNTLDAINWVAIDRREYTISRMLGNLATILRYSIHKSNELVRVRDEMEYLRKYVHLQQQRFDYSFLCTVEAEEEVRSLLMHKLLIQPLLENTLVHGFPGPRKLDEVAVLVRKAEDGERLEIVVEDNGTGMPEEQAKELNAYDVQKEEEGCGIGVRNVITRLKLYYGEQGGLYVESGDWGTRITMWFPCIR